MSSLESALEQLNQAIVKKITQDGRGPEALVSNQTQPEDEQQAKEASAALANFLGSISAAAPPDKNGESPAPEQPPANRQALEQFIGAAIDSPVTSSATAGNIQAPVPGQVSPVPPPPAAAAKVASWETCPHCGRPPLDTAAREQPPAVPSAAPSTPLSVPDPSPEPTAPQEPATPTPAMSPPDKSTSAVPWKQRMAEAESAQKNGDVDTAEAILEELNILAQTVAIEIPVRMRLVTQLATIRMDRGKVDEARELLTETLNVVKTTEFKKDIATAFCLDLLAQCFRLHNEFDEAEHSYCSAILIAEKALGKEHPGTEYFRRRQETFRQEHIKSLIDPPGSKSSQPIKPEAIEPEAAPPPAESKPIQVEARESEETEQEETQSNASQEENRTILDKLIQDSSAAAGAEKSPQSSAIAISDPVSTTMVDKHLTNAKNFLNRGDVREAEFSVRSAMEKSGSLADSDERKSEILRFMAMIRDKQGKSAEAMELYEQALTTAFIHLGHSHIQVAHCLKDLAELQVKQDQLNLAKSYYRQAILLYTSTLGDTHQTTVELRTAYENFLDDLKEE